MNGIITRQDLIPLNTYRQGRDEYVKKMIAYKNKRRIKVGPNVSLLFENRNTVLFQIQELVNSEDLTDPNELDEYISIYAGMLPDENELSATLFIELDNQEKLAVLLKKLKGIEHHLTLFVGDEPIQAVFEEVHDDREFTTSVHYLKFPLTASAKNILLNGPLEDLSLTISLDHPNLTEKVRLSPKTVESLQKDLAFWV
ncbi:DUF3501 family protein [Neobacillus sp. PS3-12]|jgi:hypothetical protein|uniref:DUF3501 family protein n=1 Tax=Neobacillus sp. PS3-12 TaxID=3070677 RepID=UPI0027E1BA7F|nr:DUF3501 family protein [Neobacillus sp. PS3-12]WML53062.1 DUF3501 family protein [Neobacillus sp. PS3-12]